MNTIVLDFETRSDVDLTSCGVYNYLASEAADIVCLGWKRKNGYPQLWTPGDPPPDFDPSNSTIYAHNAWFDYSVWNRLGVRLHGFKPWPIQNTVDTQALCGRFGLPMKLDKIGEVLRLKTRKDGRGKRLITLITQPPFKYTQQDIEDFYEYCLQDVETLEALIDALPATRLSKEEQEVWALTCKINETGLPIDRESVRQILSVTTRYAASQQELIPEITNGFLYSAKQTVKGVEWCKRNGVCIPDMKAETVAAFLGRGDLPEAVTKFLNLRQELSLSSVAKYAKLHALTTKDSRLHENLRYHAAATGRWGGMGFQAHNLPRAKIKGDIEEEIEKYFTFDIIEEDPLLSAKALLRSMIQAPEGRILHVADYSSIEYVLLMWQVRNVEALARFAEGKCQYKDMAADILGVPYEEITKSQRQFGKPIVLGCGYGLGAGGLIGYAEGYGVEMDVDDAEHAVGAFRKKYPEVPKFWYKGKDAAVAAIMNVGIPYTVKDNTFTAIIDRNKQAWLQLRLPSGRCLYYYEPELVEDKYGVAPSHMGIDSKTKQWVRQRLTPGRITENIIQALARDILAFGKMSLDRAGYDVVLSVHDEVVVEAPDEGATGNEEHFRKIVHHLTRLPDWAKKPLELPLRAEGFTARRYRKD